MKKILILLSLLLVGCSSTLPPPPQPSGQLVPVNPTKINTNLLRVTHEH